MILFKLRAAMKKKGIYNQAELQMETGIRSNTLTDIIHNRCKMLSLEVMEAICNALNSDPGEWMMYISKDKERDYWNKYAVEHYRRIERREGSQGYQLFCEMVDNLLYNKAYSTGHPLDKMEMSWLLAENGLAWDEEEQHLVPLDEYYKNPRHWGSNSKLHDVMASGVAACIIGFDDTLEVQKVKRLKLRRLWQERPDLFIEKIDYEHILPPVVREFLLRVEKRRDKAERP